MLYMLNYFNPAMTRSSSDEQWIFLMDFLEEKNSVDGIPCFARN